MISANNSEMAYVSPHGSGTEKLKTFWLRDLGSQYKVERTEDWEDCQGDEKSYGEMIRARDSLPTYRSGTSPITGKPNRILYMPSNLYKYSETELGLYMKDHRNLWPKLAEITGENFNGFDPDEEDFIFPIEKFPEIAKLVQFRQKRKTSESERERLRENMAKVRAKLSKSKDKISGNNKGFLNTNSSGKTSGNAITRLDIFNGGNPL
jgi:hypothetical protein